MPPPVTTTVPARAALVGNPSDLYRGAVLAVPVDAFAARVDVVDAPVSRVDGPEDGRVLVEAAAARVPQATPYALRWSTDIPRTVGLAGSSAIVVAVLRALSLRRGTPLNGLELAELALEVEAGELGIVAGIQDRAVQAAGAPVLVDVTDGAPVVTVLTAAAPLRIVVAWSPAAASESGDYHRALRERRGDVQAGMGELARLALTAAAQFTAGDALALAASMAASAATRATVAPLPPAHQELAAAVAAAGLSPNSTGSGGAVAAVVTDDGQIDALPAALARVGGQFVVQRYPD